MIIPEGVTEIGSWAVKDRAHIASVTISDSARSIGKEAFSGCTRLTIKASESSEAIRHAQKNGIAYEPI